jgi:type VI secretion system protein ImpH
VGGDGPASREVVRFRPEVELGFPPSSMSAVELVETRGVYGEEESRYRITSFLMGLYGAQSPLPNHYAEDILREQIATDGHIPDIFPLDLAFYWPAEYRYPVQFRSDGGDAHPALLA